MWKSAGQAVRLQRVLYVAVEKRFKGHRIASDDQRVERLEAFAEYRQSAVHLYFAAFDFDSQNTFVFPAAKIQKIFNSTKKNLQK